MENKLQPQESSRDSGGGDLSRSSDQPMTRTDGDSQSEENSRDTGGGDGLNIADQPIKNEVQTEHQEFKINIEVEAQDPDENPPPSLPPPPSPAKRPSSAFKCPLCNAQCSYRDELINHLATVHSGCNPPAKDTSGGNHFVM